MKKRHIVLAVTVVMATPIPALAAESATVSAATSGCKSIVSAAIKDKKVQDGTDPTVFCNQIGPILNPPSYPGEVVTVARISYKNTPTFYDGLRRMLKVHQGKNQEVWVDFDQPGVIPTLSSLGKVDADTGFESGLMTWISKSKQSGNQFCKTSDAQSIETALTSAGFQIVYSLFDSLIKKWNAARFYNPAKSYSIIGVYSSDPADHMKLVRMRFLPKQFLAPNCGKLLNQAPPFDPGQAGTIPRS